MTKNRASIGFLLGLTAVALSLCYVLISPFLKPIVFSAVLAMLFFPSHSQIQRFIRNRNVSALVSTVMVILLIALAVVFLGRAIAAGLRDIYQSLGVSGDGRERLSLYFLHLFERTVEFLGRFLPISVSSLRNATINQTEKWVAALLNITAGALGSITSMTANAFFAFFVLFFFFRDGRGMLRRAAVALPLKREQVRRLFAAVQDTLHAIVYGTLAMAALQGALAGLAFSMLGVASPVVWAIVTALCALLPAIGTAMVLVPAISMLVFSGHWIKGLILFAWGMAVVHPVDNLLRPYLIGGRVKLSTLYVFFAVIGGLKAFGTLGLFIGPLILAITVALFTLLREEKQTGSWDLQLHSRPEGASRRSLESRIEPCGSHITH